MTNETKFNVIIPTRERADVLVHCLHTVVAQDYENLEIIVSDNHSNDNTRDVVESFSDKRIRYINTGRRLSMSHNWEFALNHVETGWVTYLGDDDGLYPNALRVLNHLIIRHNVDAVSSRYGTFQWPNHFPDSMDGHMRIPLSGSATICKSTEMLKKALSGHIHYSRLPNLYHGSAASLDLINRARDSNSRFFCSINPDVYSAVALSSVSEKFLSNSRPIAIAGLSRHSIGESFTSQRNSIDEKPSKEFLSEDNIGFHKTLVLSKSIQIMLFECYLQATHIHRGKMNIAIADQLKLAQEIAPKVHASEIQESCREIAKLNEIEFAPFKPRTRHALKERFRREHMNILIKPKNIGVMNVYDAAIASGVLNRFSSGSWLSTYTLFVLNLTERGIIKLRKLATAWLARLHHLGTD